MIGLRGVNGSHRHPSFTASRRALFLLLGRRGRRQCRA